MITETIRGKIVQLRVAEEKDAMFTLSVRQNSKKGKYIPRIDVSIEQQKKWIAEQRDNKKAFFFVVERINGEPIGTYSIYNIKDKEAEAGRLVMLGSQLETIEAGILFSDFCFDIIGMERVKSIIVEDNLPALGFSTKLGGIREAEYIDNQTKKKMIVHVSTKESYYKKRDALIQIVERFSCR